ncbi:MAG TPA: helix-turn-helix transcriptional regulator [Blastocatellia bacterium]|nr:helix-turn-helix transcriptional regulator [Blastocatellia bacterium]
MTYRDDKLRARAAALKLSQKDIAQMTGIYQANICRIFNGQNPNPKIGTLSAIAEALGLEMAELFEPASTGPRSDERGNEEHRQRAA